VLLVPGHRDLAVAALYRRPAVEAGKGGGEAAAVEEEHRLLAAGERLVDGGLQFRGKEPVGAAPVGAPFQVDDPDGRHPARPDPLREGEERRSPRPREMPRFRGRGGGTEDHHGVLHPPPEQRQVPGLVPHAVFLLVRGVVLLVDDQQAQGRERGEDRGARPHAEERLPGADPAPLRRPLGRGQAAVEHRHAAAEAGAHPPEELGGKGDLRDEEDRLPSRGPRLLDRTQVDLRLPGAGDAVQEECGVPAGSDGHADPRQRRFLGTRRDQLPRRVREVRGGEGDRPGTRLCEQETAGGHPPRALRPPGNAGGEVGRGQLSRRADGLGHPALLRGQPLGREARRRPEEGFRPRRRRCLLPGKPPRKRRAQHLPRRRERLARRRQQEPDMARRYVRPVVQEGEKLLRLPSLQRRSVGDRRHQPGQLPVPERHEDPHADEGAPFQARRHPVRERMVDGKRHGHFDVERRGHGFAHSRMILPLVGWSGPIRPVLNEERRVCRRRNPPMPGS